MGAYVVVWLDYTLTPPTAVRAGIYSEESPSSTTHVLPHCVMHIPGEDFGAASVEAFDVINQRAKFEPQFQWIAKQLGTYPLG